MSIRAINWAFEQTCKSSSAKLVLIKLADNANDDGVCWPSLEYIGKHCQMEKSTVSRHCKELAEQGLIEIVPRFKDGVQLPNIYKFKIVHPLSDQTPPLYVRQHPVVPTTTPPLYPRQPEPSLEPSLESKAGASRASQAVKKKKDKTLQAFDRWQDETTAASISLTKLAKLDS